MQHISSQSKKNKLEPLVSIVIANYNGEAYLNPCLNSVLRSSYKNFEIVLVDDGSSDSSVEIIQGFMKKDTRIQLTRNKTNLGAAASRNRAMRHTKGEIIIFLDNDTETEKNWINALVEEFKKDPKIGAVQSVLLDFKKREFIQNAGVQLWAQTGWGLPHYQWKKYKVVKDRLPYEIIAISAALAVRKEACIVTKGFDEDEAVVTEDLDFSWRLWIAGFKIVLAKDSIVYHWTKEINMRKNMKHSKKTIYYHLTKNSLTSIIKNFETKNLFRFLPQSILISLGRSVLVFVKRHESSAFSAFIEAVFYVAINIKLILKKRRYVQSNRKNSDEVLFDSVLCSNSISFAYKKNFRKTNLL